MPLDPVCGSFVRDEGEGVAGHFGGHRYVFCSRDCLRRFTQPGRELAWLKASAGFALAAGAVLAALPRIGVLSEPWLGWLLLALGTAVQAFAGWPFYRGLREAVRARAATMDVLVVLGTTAAWLFGALEVVAPALLVEGAQQYYFEVSALVLGFVALGRAVEQRLRGEASREVRRLLELQPSVARIVRRGREEEVPIEAIRAGDVVVVRSGDAVPVDGIVVEGRGAVDEKFLTGESLPVDKRAGDRVIAGSVNKGGALRVRATDVGGATALAHIVALIGEAQSWAPGSRRTADRVSAWFAPAVLGLAGLALGGWLALGAPLPFAFGAFVAVLLVATPAVLGLAAPAALMVGVSRTADRGVLVKDVAVLERIANVDVVVFDKTGTLTRGEPALTDIRPVGLNEDELLALAASAEHGNEHPLAKTIVRAARARGLKVEEPRRVEAWAGVGLEARVDGSEVLVGSPRLLDERRIALDGMRGVVESLQEEGKTVVVVARNDELAGVLAFADPIRPEAVEAVAHLQGRGIEAALITGDTTRTARAIARQLGMRRSFAEITPHGKAAVVKALRDGEHTVAMVGDGVNDAPALAAADVGCAVGAGAGVALEAADLVLLRDDPRDLAAAIALSQRTLATVKQNLAWAFAYNAALIPVAALGLLNPVLAGFAMAFSTVPVLANSLRIKRAWDREQGLAPSEEARTADPPRPVVVARTR